MPRKSTTQSYKTRRGNNEGSIYQRADGRWCGQVTIGYKEDGIPKRKTLYGKTRAEVAKKMSETVNSVFQCGYQKDDLQNITFEDLYREWLMTYKRLEVSSRTFEAYLRRAKLHILPKFGGMTVQQISSFMLQSHFNLLRRTLSLDYVKKVKLDLDQFYHNYIINELELLHRNPVESTKVINNEKRDKTADSEDDYKALRPKERQPVLDALEHNKTLKPIIYVLMFAGLRIGEALTLRWRNIDFKRGVIHVDSSLSSISKFDENGEVVNRRTIISDTKTSASVRTIPIPIILFLALQEYYNARKRLQNRTGIPFTDPDSLFFSTQEGNLRSYLRDYAI